MAKIETYFDCDLKKAVQVQPLNGNVFSLDNNGNRIGVRIFDNGVKTTVTGTVTGRAILADNSTVNLNGGLTTVNGQSVAYVDVPQGALLIPGTIKITIQLTASGVITTLAAILSTVYQTKTDNVITPSAQVIADWNATISSAIQTQDAAIAAETAAREAADSDLKSALRSNNLFAWQQGNIDTEGHETTGNMYRTVEPISFKDIYKVSVKTGYYLAVAKYNLDGTFIERSGFSLTEKVFNYDGSYLYRLCIRNSTSSAITFNDVINNTDIITVINDIQKDLSDKDHEIACRELLYGEYQSYEFTELSGGCSFAVNENDIYVYSSFGEHCKIELSDVPQIIRVSGHSGSVSGANKYYLCAIYDANGKMISYYGTDSETNYTNVYIVVPEDAKTIYVNYNPALVQFPIQYIVPKDLSEEIRQIKDDINGKEPIYKGWDKLQPVSVETGICTFPYEEASIYTYTSQGQHRKYTVTGTPTKMKVSGASGNVGSGNNYTLGAFYSEEGTLLTRIGTTANKEYIDEIVDVPSGAKTLYVNYALGNANNYDTPSGLYVHNITNDIDAIKQEVNSITPDKNTILCYGDSLTMGAGGEGTTYPNVLQSLLGNDYDVRNYGVGGETAQQIAGRQGGVPILIEPTTIQTSAYGDVNLYSSFADATIGLLGYQSSSGLNPVTINGKKATLYWNNSTLHQTAKANDSEISITRPTSVMPFSAGLTNKTIIIWMGTNGWPTSDISDLIDMAKLMIEHNNNNNYLILGLTVFGTKTLQQIQEDEAKMFSAFGYKFINIRDYLVEYGLSDAGITPTPQDETAISEGKVPPSLLADDLHFTATGYTVIANVIHKRGSELGLW